ncbi:hypothetical protein ACQZ4Y_20105 [Rhizobium sp. L80/93]|uniref:hypothetical protein n=1 Tax=Rhizobium sp. E27B/91 TaxID=2819995 RepID=UPI001ADD5D98|nr:hypothetical protein [Rhizobium sp. E27B/91]MBO9186800.1 hypothetical protein [Rhizobium sp. E27B/91]
MQGIAVNLAKIAKVEAAPQEEAAIRAEIGALDAKEAAAAQKWAQDGADGEPPAVDVKARAALNERLAGAVAKSAANRSAIGALQSKHLELARKVSALDLPIALAANVVLMDKLEAKTAEARELIVKLIPLMASMDWGRKVIVEETHRISNSGLGHGGHDLFHRLERLPDGRALMMGDPAPNLFSEWLTELESLKQGK